MQETPRGPLRRWRPSRQEAVEPAAARPGRSTRASLARASRRLRASRYGWRAARAERRRGTSREARGVPNPRRTEEQRYRDRLLQRGTARFAGLSSLLAVARRVLKIVVSPVRVWVSPPQRPCRAWLFREPRQRGGAEGLSALAMAADIRNERNRHRVPLGPSSLRKLMCAAVPIATRPPHHAVRPPSPQAPQPHRPAAGSARALGGPSVGCSGAAAPELPEAIVTRCGGPLSGRRTAAGKTQLASAMPVHALGVLVAPLLPRRGRRLRRVAVVREGAALAAPGPGERVPQRKLAPALRRRQPMHAAARPQRLV
jgi:hypothetical protein